MKKYALIIDDDELCRKMISNFFALYGFKVIDFPSAISFLDFYEKDSGLSMQKIPLDIFLVDKEMPGMSGIELMQKLSDLTPFRDIPKAVYSGSLTKEEIEKAKILGCEIFHKPDFSKMFTWIESHSPQTKKYA